MRPRSIKLPVRKATDHSQSANCALTVSQEIKKKDDRMGKETAPAFILRVASRAAGA